MQLKHKVLVPEKLSPESLTLLADHMEVHERKGLSPDDLLKIIGDYDALVIRSETKVTADVLKAGRRLRVVARAGVGVDNVDVKTATTSGIIVVNSPQGNIGAAAEHTIALLMAVARHVPSGDASLKSGVWNRSKFVGVEVKGKTLGIVGLGKVGILVARMAQALGMTVVAFDPYTSPALAKSLSIPLIPVLKDLLSASDFVTIHTPLLPSTRGMISAPELSQMKKGAKILNVARGGTIDEPALLEALESGHLGGAGLDVYTSEPPSFKDDDVVTKLVRHPKVVATPHLGASTVEAQENVSRDVCEQIIAILRGELPRTAVNAPLILPEEYRKLQPFVRLVEKMGSLYTQHFSAPTQAGTAGSASFNFDLIYEGSLASLSNTTPLFAALIKGLLAPISDGSTGNVNIVNAELIARERGIVVNESRVHASGEGAATYSSLVTLRAHSTNAGVNGDHTISGFISAGTSPSESQIYISKVGPFKTSFVPSGHILLIHNYDSPGKVGKVGTILGAEGVNIAFMGVAPHEESHGKSEAEKEDATAAADDGVAKAATGDALMILGVDREIDPALAKSLAEVEGVLDVRVVNL